MDNKNFIIEALQQTHMLYQIRQHQAAKKYLRWYLLNSDRSAEIASTGPVFKKWWANQWMLRDQQFLYETQLRRFDLPLDFNVLSVTLELYSDIHEPRNVIASPNQYVRQEIIKRLRDEDIKERSKNKL